MAADEVRETRLAAPMPAREVYVRVADEGRERLDSTIVQLVSRAFTAGFTIVFGIVALGITYSLVAERFGTAVGDLAGSLAFGIGLVFLVVGRSELFTENFLDPVAAAVEDGGGRWRSLGRLWSVTLVMNLVGGLVLASILSVEGAMPDRGHEPLVRVAEETLALSETASFSRAIAAGAVLTLMTWLLQAAASSGSRITIAWIVGAFVALGPFNHVVVTELHLVFGHLYGLDVSAGDYLTTLGVATAGNLVGGLVFVTLARLGQVKGR